LASTVERLTKLAPHYPLDNPLLAHAPAIFGATRRNFGLHSDFVILVNRGFSGTNLQEALSGLSHPKAPRQTLRDISDDVIMPIDAANHPTETDGSESEDARLRRIHETDPGIRRAINEFFADSFYRWNLGLGVRRKPSIVRDPSTEIPLKGVISWRRNNLIRSRRWLGRVETFEAAADIGLFLVQDADLFFGRSISGVWSRKEITETLPQHLSLREATYDQDRYLLQGAILTTVSKYARQLFSRRNGLFQTLENEIIKRQKNGKRSQD
jgi:hypothetical protein